MKTARPHFILSARTNPSDRRISHNFKSIHNSTQNNHKIKIRNPASFMTTLHFLKPISVPKERLPKSVNDFCEDMKDASNP